MMKPKPAKPVVTPEAPPQPAQGGEQQSQGDANAHVDADADANVNVNASANADAAAAAAAGAGDVPPASGEPMDTEKSEAPPSS